MKTKIIEVDAPCPLCGQSVPSVQKKAKKPKKGQPGYVKKRDDTIHLKLWREACFETSGKKDVLRKSIKDAHGAIVENPLYKQARELYLSKQEKHSIPKTVLKRVKKEKIVKDEKKDEEKSPDAQEVIDVDAEVPDAQMQTEEKSE